MANVIKILRSPTAGNRPLPATTAGEPYVNFAENQFGVWNAAAVDLLAVRFWISTAPYVVGDHVLSAGNLYRCITAHTNSAPPSANWAALGAGGVTTFNTRAGAVTLTLGDVTAVLPAATALPLMNGAAAIGTAVAWSPEDHVHPSDTTRLALAGGTMTGAINLPAGAPTLGTEATNKTYVDTLVGNLQLFLGTWQVAANTPNITAGATNTGDYYIAVTVNPSTPEMAPAGIPGIGGTLIGNGDLVLWNGTIWQQVRGSGLNLAEADALYLALAGGIITGAVTYPTASATPAVDELVTRGYVDDAIIDAGTF
jgi:hypothetical protein